MNIKSYLLSLVLSTVSTSLFCQNNVVEIVDSLSWEELYNQGRYYREHSNSFRALQYLEAAEKLHKSDTVCRELALTYFNRGRYQKCIELSQSLLYPDSLDTDLYMIARSFDRMEKTDSALTYQYMVAVRNIENYNNLISLANTLIDNAQYDDALTLLNAYCAIDSTNSSVNTVKALTLHRGGRYKDAIELYEQLKQEGDDRSSTNYYLGLSYYMSKNVTYREAHAYDLLYRAAMQTEKKNAAILARLAVSEITMTQYNIPNLEYLTDSRNCFLEESHLKEMMESEDPISTIVADMNLQGEADLTRSIELMQPDKEVIFYLYDHIGDGLASNLEVWSAIKFYNKALEYHPDHYNVYYKLANQYRMAHNYEKCIESFEKYIALSPEKEGAETIEYAKECITQSKQVLFMRGK